ncbi:MAG: hypothetical protein ACOX04_00395 [Candidatus Scatomorpha sp.]|jgi:hypothetical protein
MKALIKLHLKENSKGRSFILFGILGGLLSLILLTGGSISVDNNPTEEIISQFGTQWKFLSIISGFAAVTVSMGSIERHLKEKRTELLALHGLSLDRQVFSLAIGNALVSMILSAILALVLVFIIIFKQAPTNLLGFTGAFITYLMTTGTVSLIVSALNMFLPSIVVAVLGVFLVIIGSFHQIIQGMFLNNGQLMGRILGKAMNLFPPLDVFNRLTRSLFFLEFNDGQDLIVFLIFIWSTMTIVYLASKGVSRREKI